MSLAKATKKLKFDKRLLERNVDVGELSKDELNKHLDSLPDISAEGESFKVDGKPSHANEESH